MHEQIDIKQKVCIFSKILKLKREKYRRMNIKN